MAKTIANITLGSGDLYLNDIDVGYLKGDVEFSYVREKLDFKPSGSLGPVVQFVIGENAQLKASAAEFNVANLKLAMGVTDAITSFSGNPSYNPASYEVDGAEVYDAITFGGSTTVDGSVALRFEHVRANSTKKIVVILYTAVSLSDLTLAFQEEDILMTDIVFRGLNDETRPDGDQIGMILEQE
ncbi:MAG: hypothetical protein KAS32_06930 [Candidatus Peribacteraceae bacterium]|nr:hypothetical protein [Candidatus Peribacteraceae bacterium]